MNENIRNSFDSYSSKGEMELRNDHCGPGSSTWYTLPLRTNLVKLLTKYNINSMLDAPCGDCQWMSTIELPDGFDYLGADLHTDMIDRNTLLYKNKTFVVLDITDDKLPTKDMIMVRDCLFHLTEVSKLKFLRNFVSSEIKYLLTSNHPRESVNEDLGHENSFKTINWEIEPWNFKTPLEIIIDYDEEDKRFLEHPYRTMCLWSRQQIESFLFMKELTSNLLI